MQTLKPEVRERIIKSARKNFAIHGYEKASTRMIAAGANMTVGNIYRYYKDKDALFYAVVEMHKEENPRLALELRVQRALELHPIRMGRLLGMVNEKVLRDLLN